MLVFPSRQGILSREPKYPKQSSSYADLPLQLHIGDSVVYARGFHPPIGNTPSLTPSSLTYRGYALSHLYSRGAKEEFNYGYLTVLSELGQAVIPQSAEPLVQKALAFALKLL